MSMGGEGGNAVSSGVGMVDGVLCCGVYERVTRVARGWEDMDGLRGRAFGAERGLMKESDDLGVGDRSQ